MRWKAGDDAAQFELERSRWLFELRSELLRSVRKMRAAKLRPRIDSEGVLEKAYGSFLMGVRDDGFPDLNDRENFRKLLFTLVKNGLLEEVRNHTRDCRDPDREVHSVEDVEGLPGKTVADAFTAFGDEEARALSLAGEEIMELLKKRVRPVHAMAMDILELLLELPNRPGRNQEIARHLDVGLRNVQRIIKEMKDAWDEGESPQRDTDDSRAGG